MRLIFKWAVPKSAGDTTVLVEPQPQGPYYDQRELNGYKGHFDTIEEAEAALEDWLTEPELFVASEYVLLTIYKRV